MFWNPYIETLPREYITAIQLKNLRFHLQPVDNGALTRYTLKAKRFKDLR